MRWLVLGSSPDAPAHLKRVGKVDASITTNRGGLLIQPTHYFLSDRVACEMFHELSGELQAKGAKLVTLDRLPTAIRKRGIEHFDEFVVNTFPYEPATLSGVWCLEYAIRNGADEVVMAGMQGYGDASYFTGDAGTVERKSRSAVLVAELTQVLVDKYPAVRFDCFGPIHYSIRGDNWRLI